MSKWVLCFNVQCETEISDCNPLAFLLKYVLITKNCAFFTIIVPHVHKNNPCGLCPHDVYESWHQEGSVMLATENCPAEMSVWSIVSWESYQSAWLVNYGFISIEPDCGSTGRSRAWWDASTYAKQYEEDFWICTSLVYLLSDGPFWHELTMTYWCHIAVIGIQEDGRSIMGNVVLHLKEIANRKECVCTRPSCLTGGVQGAEWRLLSLIHLQLRRETQLVHLRK